MARKRASSCPQCARLQTQNEALQARLGQLEQALQQLQQTVEPLRRGLSEATTDSSTSAKPPPSAIVTPPKPAPDPDAPQRSLGGQPGHPAHFRTPFPPEQLTASVPHRLTHCPDCGHLLEATDLPPRVVQQIDLRPLTFAIEEHQSHTSWCPHCHKAVAAPLAEAVARGGLPGPPLTALVAYLKGACPASFSTIRKFFRDVLGLTVSRGQLAKVIGKVSAALQRPYEELLGLLPEEDVVNAD